MYWPSEKHGSGSIRHTRDSGLLKSTAAGDLLPPPAMSRTGPSKAPRRARIEGGRYRVHWTQFIRRISTGTLPTESSVLDHSLCSGSTALNPLSRHVEEEDADCPTHLDEVIVDRVWDEDIKHSISEPNDSPYKSVSQKNGGTTTDRDSVVPTGSGFWTSNLILITLRYRLWPTMFDFFAAQYVDEKTEKQFEREHWHLRKSLGFWSSLFMVTCWVLTAAMLPKPFTIIDKIFFLGVVPFMTLPIPFFIMFDLPRKRPILYQMWISISTWQWPIYQVLIMYLCGYYTTKNWIIPCTGKTFFLLSFYLAALQAIGLFGLHLKRISSLVGAVVFTVLVGVLIIPQSSGYMRNLLVMVLYEIFLLFVHYMSENSERRLYSLREQLKIQFRATQKAQVNERKASESKRRLTSYVFHEVRVPLNTALLAVQNMEAAGSVSKEQELEFKALTGSLSMMSKVLNDVLDFNRMDSGRFESVAKPFAFHQVMKSMFMPLQMATNARKLELDTSLDDSIDLVARRALYDASDLPSSEVAARLACPDDEEAFVVGDETRLRQVITNLASNACKFTPAGGRLRIATKLIHPIPMPATLADTDQSPDRPGLMDADTSESDHSAANVETDVHGLSSERLNAHNRQHTQPRCSDHIIVRIEVTDTGSGIKPRDLADSKLFSAFNQTELGRLQGGKGTGLGLALVRQIVKLSGGRLGLISHTGEASGSTFWVELPFGVGAKALVGLPSQQQALLRTPSKRRGPPPPTPVDAAQQRRMNSAMHGLMDQAGLVELAPVGASAAVITRTLGDPSTGTHTPAFGTLRLDVLARPPLQSLEHMSEMTVVGTPDVITISPDLSAVDVAVATVTAKVKAANAETVEVITPEKPSQEPLEVLVVDDDPLTRTLMKRLLSRLGCSVSTADNGEAAIQLVLARPAKDPYAVVFLDNQMPVMTGVEAVASLREAGRHDFMVGVTGNALLSDQAEYLAAGIDHVLTKPVLERNLRAMLLKAEERMLLLATKSRES